MPGPAGLDSRRLGFTNPRERSNYVLVVALVNNILGLPRKQSVLEHRLFATCCLGRPLRPSEIVHHIDGNSRNNAPANLMVVPSQGAHRYLHRRPAGSTVYGRPLRGYGEPNPLVSCRCGCGAQFTRFDSHGRRREWCLGHSERSQGVGTPRRGVRGAAGADASARRPYLHTVLNGVPQP
jgi:hypothetical protein